jgi:hypothetical protein
LCDFSSHQEIDGKAKTYYLWKLKCSECDDADVRIGCLRRKIDLHPGIGFDAVKHLLLCRIERRPARLDMENYPHLPLAQVRTAQAADYMSLVTPQQACLPGTPVAGVTA